MKILRRQVVFLVIAFVCGLPVFTGNAQSPARPLELSRFTQDSAVRALAFSPDGQRFLSGGDRLILWDLASGRELRRFNREASGAVFLPNGKQFVSFHERRVRVWDVESAKELGDFETEARSIIAAWPSLDSQSLLTYAWEIDAGMFYTVIPKGAVQLWDLNARRELHKAHERDVVGGILLPNGTAAYASVVENQVSLMDLRNSQPLIRFDSAATFSGTSRAFVMTGRQGDRDSFFFSPNGRRAVSAHKEFVRFWDTESGKLLKEIPTVKEWEVAAGDGGSNVVFSVDGRYVAWAIKDSTDVRLVSADTGTELRRFAHNKKVLSVAFSPDGRRLLSGTEDKIIRLWDISTLGPITTLTQPPAVVAPPPSAASNAASVREPPAAPVSTPARTPTGVPRLSYQVRVQGANGNSILRGGEEFTVRVQVTNSGTAPANEVRVRLAGDAAVISSVVPQRTIAAISVGQNDTVEFAGILPSDVEARNAEIEVSLALGNNTLPDVQVVSFGVARGEVRRTRTVLSQVIDVDDVPDAVRLPERDSSFAVVIGLGSYRETAIQKIPFARSDAEIMAKYLENVAGIPRQNIRILLDDRASRTDIEEALEEWLPRRVTEKSTVIVYYAGHGALDPSTGEAYLVPYEGHADSPSTRLYSMKRLYEKLEALKSSSVTVLLDSCFSGSGGRSVAVSGRPVIISGPNLEVKSTKLSILAAAQGNQVSSDFERVKHGLFTYFALKGIRGEADVNSDGWVDLHELFTFTRTNVQATAISELNREQVPALNGGGDVQQRARDLKLFARPPRQ